MSRSFSLLVNPRAGEATAGAAAIPVARALRDAGARVEVRHSRRPSDMERLVPEAAARGDVVVGVGGDGMLHSLLGPAVEARATIGIVPAGRGNDFVRMLGLPDDPIEIAGVLLQADARTVDLLAYQPPGGGQPCYVAGQVYSGADARSGALVNKVTWLPRRWQYPLTTRYALWTFRPAEFEMRLDGELRRYRGSHLIVANAAYYGSGVKIAPTAVLDDGRLDVVTIHASSARQLIDGLPYAYAGTHLDLDFVDSASGRRVEMRAGRGEVMVGADGEQLGRLPALGSPEPAVVSIVPGAIAVIAGPSPAPTTT